MRRLLTLALALSFAAAPAFGQGASLSGTWNVKGDVMGVPVEEVCTFTQDGRKLTGSCKSAGKESAKELTGEVDDKKVKWTFKAEYNGEAITVSFAGTLDAASQLKGDIDVQPFGVGGTFEAKKDEAKKEETKKPQR